MHESTSNIPFVLHTRVMAGSGGGPEKTITNSAKYLNPARYQMAAAYIYPQGDPGFETFKEKAVAAGCELIGVPERRAMDFQALKKMRQLCVDRDVTIWHGHDYKSNLFGLLARRKYPDLKLITTVHLWTEETFRLKLYRKVDEWCLSRYDRVIAVSDALAEHCLRVGVKEKNLVMIDNAIEPDLWERTKTPEEARRTVGLEPEPLSIGFVGRFSVQKALDVWVKVAAELKRSVEREIRFVLIGAGPEEMNLKAWIKEAGLENVVVLPGWQNDLRAWYEAMDFVLMTSVREGLPNTLLESMSMAVASACTDVGGVRSLYDEGVCGLLIEPDAVSAAKIIQPYLVDDTARRGLADKARARIEAKYSFIARMDKVMAEYDRLF